MANEVEAQFFSQMGRAMREQMEMMLLQGYHHTPRGGAFNQAMYRERADMLLIQFMLYAIPAEKVPINPDPAQIFARGKPRNEVCARMLNTDGRIHGNEVVLARYLKEQDLWLLNGDGFTDAPLTRMQTTFRNQCRAAYPGKSIVVPFQALNSAGVVYDSLKILEVTEDFEGFEWHPVPDVPVVDEGAWQDMATVRLEEGSAGPDQSRGSFRNYIIQHENMQYRCTLAPETGSYANRNPTWHVWANMLRGAGPADWRPLQTACLVQNPDTGMLEEWFNGHPGSDEQPDSQWCWTEEVHRLGASVFSAEDQATEKRHRWLSAFDQNEPDALYFLAQLPDKGKVATYEDALHLLSPPIVHEARAEGRRIDRQGDVFAVETDLTDEQVYERAKWRVRREVVLWEPTLENFSRVQSGGLVEPQPAQGEVTERIDCPCGCGNKRKVGYGPLARRTLMIHGTAHTATEVAVCDKGVTFMKGTMHHDPQLNEPGRARDHIDRPLAAGRWYLAVRNTVPAMDTRQAQVTEPEIDRLMSHRTRPRRAAREQAAAR